MGLNQKIASIRNRYYSTLIACALILGCARTVTAQRHIPCPDGDHVEIDIKQIAIKYDASEFASTLSSLSILSSRLEVVPHKLQEASVATQQWNEFVKGLAVGYNSCAITRQQYADGLNRIYPRLKEDATSLEQIRKQIADGQRAAQSGFRQSSTVITAIWLNSHK